MKKWICLALCLVFVFSICATADVASLLLNAGSNPLPDIYEKVSPSIAAITNVTRIWYSETDSVVKQELSSGSAVYVWEGGYFLTNYHVVEDSDELEISFGDGVIYEAFVVGFDEATDVAVVKVDEELDREPIAIGSSAELRVGDIVCAIGSPMDSNAIYNTLTAGIVSGIDRYDADATSLRAVGLIQTDALINPGSSGGALINLAGELVGIPFLKYTSAYSEDENGNAEIIPVEGLGFAVPIDVAWPIAQSIINTGSYIRPRFGVSVISIEGPEEALKNYPPAGMQVENVEEGGSGAKAGLRKGDVITHVNGTRVYDFREYTKIVDKLAAGESFTITVARYYDEQGEKLKKVEILDLTVTLEYID